MGPTVADDILTESDSGDGSDLEADEYGAAIPRDSLF